MLNHLPFCHQISPFNDQISKKKLWSIKYLSSTATRWQPPLTYVDDDFYYSHRICKTFLPLHVTVSFHFTFMNFQILKLNYIKKTKN